MKVQHLNYCSLLTKPFKMKRILIVEDEPNMVNGLKDNLEFEGYQIETALEGTTGMQKVLNGKFDLILLDIMLPEI